MLPCLRQPRPAGRRGGGANTKRKFPAGRFIVSSTSIGGHVAIVGNRSRGDIRCRLPTQWERRPPSWALGRRAAMAMMNKNWDSRMARWSAAFASCLGLPLPSHIGTLHPANGQALSAGLRRDPSGGPGLAAGRAGRDRLACRGTACLVACACGRDSHLLCGGQEPRSRGCRGSVGIGLVGHDDTRRLGALRLFQKGVSSAMPQASDQPVPRDAGDHQRHRGRFPRRVLELAEIAFGVRRKYESGQLTADQMVDDGLTLGCHLEDSAKGRFKCEANRTLANLLLNMSPNGSGSSSIRKLTR